MKFSNHNLAVVAILTVFCSHKGSSQLDSLFKDYEQSCTKTGGNILGLLPPESEWVINIPCKSYQGTVWCHYEKETDTKGYCLCNQGEENAYFDTALQACRGKVGAYCTAEKTTLIPPKLCTPNADCVSIQSEGHTVGTCQCVYGFKNQNGLCVRDTEIPDNERSTPRTTTTTEAPKRGNLKLPLKLIFGGLTASFGEDCTGPDLGPDAPLFPLLNRTVTCETHGLTVACSASKKCECSMGGDDDSTMDEELGVCVGRAGSYCLTRNYLLGFKGCVEGADCFLEDEDETELHSFGVCKCMYGYDEMEDGTCTRNPDIEDPATKKPIGPVTTQATTTTPRTTTAGAGHISITFFSILPLLGVLHFLK